MEAWMLTLEEIAIAVDRAYNVEPSLGAFNAIAQAQADKMIRAGFKSPSDFASSIAINDQEWGDEIQRKVVEARQEALREAGELLDKFEGRNRYMNTIIDALKSGRMPETKP